MKNEISTPLIGYMRQLESEGITDIETIAEHLYDHHTRQIGLGLYSNGRYTQSGSDVQTNVISDANTPAQECILWCINHYLGLNRNQNVIDKVCKAVQEYGTSCGTSALSGGMSKLHKQVEQKLKDLVGKESVLLFPTGYTTNMGCLAALPGKNDLVIFDRESHASLIDGVKLSGKKWISFKHNDLKDLDKKIRKI